MSIPKSFEGRVVVGFDGSSVGSSALDWAGMYAAKRSLPLTIVTAVQLPAPAVGDGAWFDPATDLVDAAAQRELKAGFDQLAASYPGLEVNGYTELDSPARLLIEASKTAVVVVVGSRGRGEVAGLMLGSVSNAVAAHAHGPVVVVPRSVPYEGDGPVVVGVDSGEDCTAAIEFALRTASEVGLPVRFVHAWGVLRSWAFKDEQHAELVAAVEKTSQEFLAKLLREAKEKYPGLEITTKSKHGSPVTSLAEEAQDARMVVVGSRGRGGFTGLLLGSTSRGVLHSAKVPVGIVRARS